jgi:hypothetical protein
MRLFVLITITTLCCCQQKQGTKMNRDTFYISNFDEIFSHELWKKKSLTSLVNQKSRSALDDKEKFIYDAICDGVMASINQIDSTFYPSIMSKVLKSSNLDIEVEKVFVLHYFESGEVYSERVNILLVSKTSCLSFTYKIEGTEDYFQENQECNIENISQKIAGLVNEKKGLKQLNDTSIILAQFTKDNIDCDVVISPPSDIINMLF